MVGIPRESADAALPSKGAAAGDGSDSGSGEGGAVAAAVREAVVQRARCGHAEYVEEEAADFQGQPFRKCKPAMKLVGADNPQVGAEGRPIGCNWCYRGRRQAFSTPVAAVQFTGEDEEGWGPPIQCKVSQQAARAALGRSTPADTSPLRRCVCRRL